MTAISTQNTMQPNAFSIHYTLSCDDPKAHLLKVTLTIDEPCQPVQSVSLPTWIPGSYLVRDFAKHITGLKAYTHNKQVVELTPCGLSSWTLCASEKVTLEYYVYAWDLSVRKAHFDESHAFFNGTSVFLAVDEQRDRPVKVTLLPSEITQQNHWQAASGMADISTDHKGFGDYWALDYQDLIEYPFEIGNFVSIDFDACGIPHKMVFTGILPSHCDFTKIADDVKAICETEINFFGQPAPMNTYLFQVMVTGSDYGGLEHRNSTALICSRNDLPFLGMENATDGYLQFLELCSHEYFHTWNVKRIQPLAYQQTQLDKPAISQQLWWFEGVTSYYDALFLLKSGRINKTSYLDLLGKQLTRVYQMPGRFEQSVAQSSHYTWTKFYQQDEDAPNSIISYYTKGSLIALALDLTLRFETQNQCSLDMVVKHLWANFGSKGIGLQEQQIEAICSELSIANGGPDLSAFFEQLLYGTEDFDFETLFKKFNYEFILRPAQNANDTGGHITCKNLSKLQQKPTYTLGARLQDLPAGGVKVTHVWNQQAIYHAGITSGDEIIAMDHIKISTKSQIDQLVEQYHPSQSFLCHFFRRDELKTTTLKPELAVKDRVTIIDTNESETDYKWLDI